MKKNYDDGFTFAETIASLAIILILSCGVGFAAFKFIDRAKEVSVHSQILNFKTALNAYYLDCGFFPTEAQGLEALWEKPIISPVSQNWKGPYLDKKIPQDPWGNAYEYKANNNLGLPYVIFSYGKNGKIENWEHEDEESSIIFSWQ